MANNAGEMIRGIRGTDCAHGASPLSTDRHAVDRGACFHRGEGADLDPVPD
jgi:hypothetical protein